MTGEGFEDYFRSGTTAPGFACAANGGLPCAWGAVKGLRALARIPPRRRTPPVRRALRAGTAFLLGRDPAVADYPTPTRVSSSWFKLGVPSGYVADVLQNLETLDRARPRETLAARTPSTGCCRSRTSWDGGETTTLIMERHGSTSSGRVRRASGSRSAPPSSSSTPCRSASVIAPGFARAPQPRRRRHHRAGHLQRRRGTELSERFLRDRAQPSPASTGSVMTSACCAVQPSRSSGTPTARLCAGRHCLGVVLRGGSHRGCQLRPATAAMVRA